MANDERAMDDSPDPLTDLRKGLGLLFRAARTAAKNLPTKDFEEVVTTSAREVGRAIENVAATIEREIRSKTGPAKGPTESERPPKASHQDEDRGHDPPPDR